MDFDTDNIVAVSRTDIPDSRAWQIAICSVLASKAAATLARSLAARNAWLLLSKVGIFLLLNVPSLGTYQLSHHGTHITRHSGSATIKEVGRKRPIQAKACNHAVSIAAQADG